MIDDAETHAEYLLDARTIDLHSAAAAYRKRRGRHPPPGFDAWFAWGKKHDRLMVEEFFDQIYEDLEPYWGISPSDIRASVASWPSDTLRIRNGKVLEHNQGRFRTRTWAKMLKEISRYLPDLEMAANPLDEPRILVPKERISRYLEESARQKTRMMAIPTSRVISSFPRLDADQHGSSKARFDITNVASYHQALRAVCGEDRDNVPDRLGMSMNTTSAKDVCMQPQLLQQHGFFLEPATISLSTAMIPVFSATKTSINNDILLPEPAYYFDQYGLFSEHGFWSWFRKSVPWSHKKHGMVWRGGATGGVARSNTWQQFHRHRFVRALNSTLHQDDQANHSPEWLHHHSDAAFTSLSCNPNKNGKESCSSLASNFLTAPPLKMHKQFGWKYLPDIDGNSLSGRFRAFMLSSSTPIKSTIFKEWHDGRLVPWKHFVPVSIGFEEIYDVMKWFLGDAGGRRCAHDEAGERIAEEGRIWAERVLGKEDMLLYLWRVVLEYARLVDDGREFLGFVGDLRG